MRRLGVLIACTVLPLALWALLPLVSGAAPTASDSSKLERRIDSAREKIGRKKGAERTLTSEIRTYSRRIDRLQGRISTLGGRQDRLESDLAAKEAELERIRSDLRAERARLVRLRERLEQARRLLRVRLVEIYKAEEPDLVSVVLNSDGFADLLERSEFIRRISDNDREIVGVVRRAKADATRTEKRLDRLERRQEAVTEIIQRRRDEVAAVKMQLIGTRVGYDRTRSGKSAALQKVRVDRRELEAEADALEAEQAKVQAALRRAQSRFTPSAGPIKRGSGQLIYPVNGPLTSPFGPRWGRLHAGIDISAPGGTPIRAADSGKVVIAGSQGGYGLYTCIQHTASMSTCYAHQSRLGTRTGATVSKGDVMGYVGNTGNSFGNHLHFEVRINGSPVDPMGYL